MSLMKTLGRVAAGVILAKGIGAAMQQHQQGRPGQVTRNRSQGGLLGELFGNNTGTRTGGGGLNDMLGQVLGGRGTGQVTPYGGPQSRGASGGLGGLLGGRLGDVIGQVKAFEVGLAVFVLASLVRGVAPSPAVLVLARVIQGIGAAVTAPSGGNPKTLSK